MNRHDGGEVWFSQGNRVSSEMCTFLEYLFLSNLWVADNRDPHLYTYGLLMIIKGISC